ncbi:MAG: hypothetical protein AAFY64_04335 [Pseudomonadota bacterium]
MSRCKNQPLVTCKTCKCATVAAVKAVAIIAAALTQFAVGRATPANAQAVTSQPRPLIDPGTTPRLRQAPGSRVRLALPSSWAPSDRFTGFQHPSGASIVILEVPAAAYPQMSRAMEARLLASRGIVDVKPLKLDRAIKSVALTGRQATPAGWFDKIMMVTADDRTTVLLTANIPERDADDNGDNTPQDRAQGVDAQQLIATFEGMRFADEVLPARPQYTLTYTGPLKSAGTFAGAATAYNETGTLPKTRIKDARPLVIVAHAINTVQVTDLDGVANRLLKSLRGYRDIILQTSVPTRIDGMRAVIQTGGARVAETDESVALLQAFMVDPGGRGYYRVIAIAPAARRAELLGEYEKMARSFRRIARRNR